MEILLIDDMMLEISNNLIIDDLRNIFFAFHYLEKRWIKQLKIEYRNKIKNFISRLTNARNACMNIRFTITDPRERKKILLAFVLLRLFLLKSDKHKNIFAGLESLNYKINDPDLNYVIDMQKENRFSKLESKIYDKIFNHTTMPLGK